MMIIALPNGGFALNMTREELQTVYDTAGMASVVDAGGCDCDRCYAAADREWEELWEPMREALKSGTTGV